MRNIIIIYFKISFLFSHTHPTISVTKCEFGKRRLLQITINACLPGSHGAVHKVCHTPEGEGSEKV